jgi:hypothetical protein
MAVEAGAGGLVFQFSALFVDFAQAYFTAGGHNGVNLAATLLDDGAHGSRGACLTLTPALADAPKNRPIGHWTDLQPSMPCQSCGLQHGLTIFRLIDAAQPFALVRVTPCEAFGIKLSSSPCR